MRLRSICRSIPLFTFVLLISACAGGNASPRSSPALETDQSTIPDGGEFIHPLSTPLQTEGFPTGCLAYPDDFQFVEVPQPLAEQNPTYPLLPRTVPQVGECFHDLQFGSLLRRVTQIEGYNGRHEYSRHDPYNSDQSMIILISDQGNFRVYRTLTLPYNQPDNLIAEVNLSEPRWDPEDPITLWGLQDFTLQTLNFDTGDFTVIKDFSQDSFIGPLIAKGTTYRITEMDEGESSLDKRYWAFALQGNEKSDYRYLYLFTWDRKTDTTLGVYPSDHPLSQKEGGEIDWISMSSLGNWVLIGGMDTNQGNLAGLTLASKDFTFFHRMDFTTAHSDIGLDVNGDEVIVMQNYNTDTIDMIPLDPAVKPILEPNGSYAGTNRIPLIRLFYSSDSPNGVNSGVHISCNTPGYCFISTNIAPGLKEQNWLDRSLILVRLDPTHPRVFYLAKLYGTTSEEPRVYWDEPQGSITADGSLLVWADNWNEGVSTENVFMMQMIMPTHWKALTGGK
jgi:hypothetical protein